MAKKAEITNRDRAIAALETAAIAVPALRAEAARLRATAIELVNPSHIADDVLSGARGTIENAALHLDTAADKLEQERDHVKAMVGLDAQPEPVDVAAPTEG